jgi:uncharacterized paraquat-inducible protein A
VLTLGGGAQACLASCATPAQTAKPACHRCEKPKNKTPQPPCPRCQLAGQDRTTADGHQVTIPALTLTFAPATIEQPLPIRHSITTPREPTHGPPGDLFHQSCLLLI